jgi:hypothetical protein
MFLDMTFMLRPGTANGLPTAAVRVVLIAGLALTCLSRVHAHPLEYHLEPLEAAAVERVLTTLEQLTAELDAAGRLDAARLPGNALGITAVLWSLQDAVASLDKTSPAGSPTLLQSLTAAGYEASPYVVAEWKFEAERVLQAYEVLSDGLGVEDISRALTDRPDKVGELSPEEAAEREMVLIRQLSLLHTTAGDIAQVANYRQRLDALTRRLSRP